MGYLIIILQIYCVYHILSKQKEWWWILVVIFLPIFGCLYYLYKNHSRQTNIAQEYDPNKKDFSSIFNPGGKIKELEKKVEFSSTFVNKIALGDAYLVEKMYDEAIAIYESSRTGVHDNDPHLNHQLMNAYFHKKEYEKVIELAEQASRNTAFKKSNAKVLYALSLESIGAIDKANSILQSMNGQYADLEPRILYAKFLVRQNREADAKEIYSEIIAEAEHMSGHEMKTKRQWVEEARSELKRV